MTADLAARVPRIAWVTTFVVPLVLALLLLGVRSAHAAPIATAVPLAFTEEFDAEEEGEFAEDECEEAEEEFEEGELGELEVEQICEAIEDDERKKATGPNSVAPEECLLRSAHARLVAFELHDEVRLTVGYTAYEPGAATVDFGLGNGNGSLRLGTAKRHLGRSGVIRLHKALADPRMTAVEAASRLTVRLHVVGAPAECRRFETERLNVRRASKSQVVWSEPK